MAAVTPGGPAQRANLQPSSPSSRTSASGGVVNPDGDVITKFGDDDVNGPEDVTRLVNEREPGDRVTLRVKRGGATRDVQVTLGDRTSAPSSSGSSPGGTLTIPTNPSNPSNPSNPTTPSNPLVP